MTRVVAVPRWGGSPADDWYPWIGRELRHRGIAFEALRMPSPAEPRVEDWVHTVVRALDGGRPLDDTVVCGHSVGCRAVLRAVEGLPATSRVRACVLVAAWWQVDEPWPEVRRWEAVDHDGARIRAVAGRPLVLLSDNDPYTADVDVNRRLWRERLDADVRVVPGAAHFNGAQEPAVLAALLEAAGAAGRPSAQT